MSEICLRPVRDEDADMLLRWRSDERVYRWLKNAAPPSEAAHAYWFQELIRGRTNLRAFVIDHIKHGPVGFCSYTIDPCAELGIYLAPEHQGKGYGSQALELLMADAAKGAISSMKAIVHPENTAAIRLYEKLGFKLRWLDMEAKL